MLYVPLKRELLLDEVLYIPLLGLAGLQCSLNLLFPCHYSLVFLTIIESGILRSPTIIVKLSIFPEFCQFLPHIFLRLCCEVHICL